MDLPTAFEAGLITNTAAKFVYGFFYILIYGVRPLWVRPKAFTTADAVNWASTIGVALAILHFWGLKSVVYLVAGTILGGGLHPMAGHLLAEHYMFEKVGGGRGGGCGWWFGGGGLGRGACVWARPPRCRPAGHDMYTGIRPSTAAHGHVGAVLGGCRARRRTATTGP